MEAHVDNIARTTVVNHSPGGGIYLDPVGLPHNGMNTWEAQLARNSNLQRALLRALRENAELRERVRVLQGCER